jgi:hypothetical protein
MSSVKFSNPDYWDKAVCAAADNHSEAVIKVRDENSLVEY